MQLTQAEIKCLLQGKEPTMQEVAKATSGLTYAEIHERFKSIPARDYDLLARNMVELEKKVDWLNSKVYALMARLSNKRMNAGL